MVLLRVDVSGDTLEQTERALADVGRMVQRTFRDADMAGRVDGTDCGVLLANVGAGQTEVALTRLEPGWRRNAVLGASGGILIFSAISRPTFGAHWPSDALGGVLLGGIWLLATTRLYLSMRRPGELPRPLRRPIALAESLLLATTPQRLVQRLRRP